MRMAWRKPTKRELLYNIPAAVMMCVLSILCLHISLIDKNSAADGQTIWGHAWENVFIGFSWIDGLIFVVFGVLWLGLLLCLSRFMELISDRSSRSAANSMTPPPTEQPRSLFFAFLVASVLIVLCWLPYILSWFPGGVYSDTQGVIWQALSGQWTNRHTFFYTFCWWVCISAASFFHHGLIAALGIMTLLQVLLFSTALAFSLTWLYRHGLSMILCCFVLAFYCLFPAFPLFAISLWKDSFFSIFLFLFALLYVDIFLAKRITYRQCLSFCILALLVSFSRNNGAYIVFGSFLIMLFIKNKTLLGQSRPFLIIGGSTLLLILLIQGPVYSFLQVSAPFIENIGVPLQQLAAVIYYEGHLDAEQMAYLDSIMPISSWIETYRPCLVDPLKWNSSFDSSIITSDVGRFWKMYFTIGLNNPIIYAKAFLMNNCGFWDPFVGGNENVACYQITMWPSTDYAQWDVIQLISGHSLRGILEPTLYPTAGVFAWCMLISIALLVNARMKPQDGLALAPILLLWLTLLIATPLAYSLRYFFTAVMLLPIFIFLPILMKKEPRPHLKPR